MTKPALHTPWKTRFLALLCYLGAAPFFDLTQIFSRHRDTPKKQPQNYSFFHHHQNQALALFFILFLILITFLLTILILSYLLIYQRPFYDATHPEPHLFALNRRLLLAWLVFWGYGLLLALLGSSHPMPIVARIAKRPLCRHTSTVLLLLLYTTIALLLPFTLHANHLAQNETPDAAVYMLYEDVDVFPHWIFPLGLYRVSLEAHKKWGEHAVKVAPVSRESIAEALQHGRFIFIGSHGLAPGLLLKEGYIKPQDVALMPKNKALQFVYLTSCDSGARKADWEAAFAPGKVITHNRLTAVVEHIWWLFHTAPRIIPTLD